MATTTANAADINNVVLAQKRAFEARLKASKEKTPAQMVVESWTTVMEIVDYEQVAGEILLRRVFELSYDAFRLFPYAKKYPYNDEALFEDDEFVASSTAVIGTITAAVGLLEQGDTDTLDLVLNDIGFRYFKFNATHYDTIGEALLFTLEMALDTDFTTKVKQAWESVFVVVKKQITKGAAEARAMEKNKALEEVVSADDVVNEEIVIEAAKPKAFKPQAEVKPSVQKKLSFEDPVQEENYKSSITWILTKDKKSSKSGLTFASRDGIVVLRAVEGRAAAKTNMSIGLQVLKIDGTEVTSATKAVKAFADAPAGPVKIVTSGSHHCAKKMGKDDKAGFAIQPYASDKNLMEIYKVNPNGMFPDIQPGQLLWSINGKRITSVSQGIKKLRSKKVLMLVVMDPADLGGIKSSDIKEPSYTPGKPSEEPTSEPNPAEEEPEGTVLWT